MAASERILAISILDLIHSFNSDIHYGVLVADILSTNGFSSVCCTNFLYATADKSRKFL